MGLLRRAIAFVVSLRALYSTYRFIAVHNPRGLEPSVGPDRC